MTILFTPESYAEFMNLDLQYVTENWDSIHEKLVQELNDIFGS